MSNLSAFTVVLGATFFFLFTACSLQEKPEIIETGGDFELTNQDGLPWKLSRDGAKPQLLYFGYLRCPEVCPLTLFKIGQVRKRLGKQAAQIGTIFISVDVERDSPQAMKSYFSNFDVPVTGLTGSRAQIDAVVKQWGAFYEKESSKPGDLSNCEYDHSVYTYLIDSKGKVRHLFKYEDRPDEYLYFIKKLL